VWSPTVAVADRHHRTLPFQEPGIVPGFFFSLAHCNAHLKVIAPHIGDAFNGDMWKWMPLIICALTLLTGCGKEESAPAPTPKPESTAPQKATTGKVSIVGMEAEPVIEVISVGFIPNRVYEMVTRQQQALDAYLNPKSEEDSGSSKLVSQQDFDRLTAQIDSLKQKFPDRVTTPLFGEGSELTDFTSRESLSQRYKTLVDALSVDTLISGINEISEKMRADHKLLTDLVAKGGEGSNQAKADINWLAAFSQYMQGYQSVVAQFDEARRKEGLRQAQEAHAKQQMASPKETWKQVQGDVANQIELELYKAAADTAYADEDGNFQVTGHGKLIIRAIHEGYSVFLVHDGPGGDYIEIDDIQNIFIEPAK